MFAVAAKVNAQLLLHLSDVVTYAITLSSQKTCAFQLSRVSIMSQNEAD